MARRRRTAAAGGKQTPGVRRTAARTAVLGYLQACDCHATADGIFRALRPRHPRLGLATVYRTLQLLVRLGQVQKIEAGDGSAHYELTGTAATKPHHHHLVCQSCGAIIDHGDFVAGEQATLQRIVAALEKKYGFVITGHAVQFAGTCPACRRTGATGRMKGGGAEQPRQRRAAGLTIKRRGEAHG
jgi:Fur family transcriptional regulator, ferric uptake regulator